MDDPVRCRCCGQELEPGTFEELRSNVSPIVRRALDILRDGEMHTSFQIAAATSYSAAAIRSIISRERAAMLACGWEVASSTGYGGGYQLRRLK